MGSAKLISFLLVEGLRLFLALAIVIFAIIAARKHKLGGLWVLVAATIMAALNDLARVLISSPIAVVHHDDALSYLKLLGPIYFLITLATFIGWCALAFCKKPSHDAQKVE